MLTPKQRAAKYGKTFSPAHKGHVMERFGYFKDPADGVTQTPQLRSVRSAHALLTSTWEKIYGLIEASQRDATKNEAQKIMHIAGEARRAANNAKAFAQTALEHAAEDIRVIEQDFERALRPSNAPDITLDQEIRTHLRSLPPNEAQSLAVKMAETEAKYGLAVYRAIASAPPFLSGVNEQAHGMFRERYLETVRPDNMAVYRQYDADVAVLVKGMLALDEHVSDFVDVETAEMLESLQMKPLEVK